MTTYPTSFPTQGVAGWAVDNRAEIDGGASEVGGGGSNDSGLPSEDVTAIVDDTAGWNQGPGSSDINGGIKLTGKNGGVAKVIFDFPTGPTAGKKYTVGYSADWSQLNNLGKDVFIGFALLDGVTDDFYAMGLTGNGTTVLKIEELWGATDFSKRKPKTDFNVVTAGNATNGVLSGPNFMQIVFSGDGTTATFKTSGDDPGDGTGTYDTELADQSMESIANVSEATRFGIFVFVPNSDKGAFEVTVTFYEEASTGLPAGSNLIFDDDFTSLANWSEWTQGSFNSPGAPTGFLNNTDVTWTPNHGTTYAYWEHSFSGEANAYVGIERVHTLTAAEEGSLVTDGTHVARIDLSLRWGGSLPTDPRYDIIVDALDASDVLIANVLSTDILGDPVQRTDASDPCKSLSEPTDTANEQAKNGWLRSFSDYIVAPAGTKKLRLRVGMFTLSTGTAPTTTMGVDRFKLTFEDKAPAFVAGERVLNGDMESGEAALEYYRYRIPYDNNHMSGISATGGAGNSQYLFFGTTLSGGETLSIIADIGNAARDRLANAQSVNLDWSIKSRSHTDTSEDAFAAIEAYDKNWALLSVIVAEFPLNDNTTTLQTDSGTGVALPANTHHLAFRIGLRGVGSGAGNVGIDDVSLSLTT